MSEFGTYISAGIKFLDANVRPDWRALINLDSLNMERTADCILGQIYGNYWNALDGLRISHEEAKGFGFASHDSSVASYGRLGAAWRETLSAPAEPAPVARVPFSETRTTSGFYLDPSDHFFFDGVGIIPGSHGRGNFARGLSGALHGRIKVTPLSSGKVSLRSTGRKGDGMLVHMSATSKVVIDGRATTLAALIG